MEPVLRATAVYVFVLVLTRVIGKRALSEVTTFDFLLLLVIAETTQQALLGDDFSVTNCFVLILTLVTLDQGLVVLSRRFKRLDRWAQGVPLVLVENGEVHLDRLRQAQVDIEDVLASARELQGLEELAQIKHAVLERHGGISVIPWGR